MKKFITFFLSPFLVIILAVLKIPQVEKALVGTGANRDEWALLYLVVGIVAATMLIHIVTVTSPYKKYERWAKNKWYFLDQESSRIISKYKGLGFVIRMNIMTPKGRFMHWIHPFMLRNKELRRPKLFGRVFQVVWSSGNFGVNKRLKISLQQGICGSAFETANSVVADEFVSRKNKYNFNKKQLKLTSNLVMVASFRIMDETNTPEKKSDRVIGVLNFESDTPGSEVLVTDADKHDGLVADMASFSLVCGKLI